jgi:NAD(P)-dependent dehydrogenase (short-subunit alcohol dehydrogenase family)
MATRDITTLGARTTAAEVLEGIDLTGRTALVTGAASGIGVETARALAGAGATVTLAVRDVVAGSASPTTWALDPVDADRLWDVSLALVDAEARARR